MTQLQPLTIRHIALGIFSAVLVVVFVWCLNVSNEEVVGHPPATAEEHRVVAIANDYVAAHYSHSSALSRPAAVLDRRGRWEVTYPLPVNVVGGRPTITIDKKSRAVVSASHTQ